MSSNICPGDAVASSEVFLPFRDLLMSQYAKAYPVCLGIFLLEFPKNQSS